MYRRINGLNFITFKHARNRPSYLDILRNL